MNKQELAKEIELQEERLIQLKKEYKEKAKPNPKVGQCFSKHLCNNILVYHYKIISIDKTKHRPIKAIRVEKNKSIEIVNLYLEDYSFLLAISTEEFSDLYSKTLKTISNYYEQG